MEVLGGDDANGGRKQRCEVAVESWKGRGQDVSANDPMVQAKKAETCAG